MPFDIQDDSPKPERMITPGELAAYINELASKSHDYNSICDGCVEVMLRARKTFTDTAKYGLSGAQAAMIGQEIARRLS